MRALLQAALAVEMPGAAERVALREYIRRQFPHVQQGYVPDSITIDVSDWSDPDASLLEFDRRVNPLEDHVRSTGMRVGFRIVGREKQHTIRAITQILDRYQRLFPRWPGSQSTRDVLASVLDAHASMHDIRKPLVRADYDHAIDVWQWVLRLCAQASLALQVSALFHDIERLVSECDIRVEQRASNYLQFKHAHASNGSVMLRAALAELGLGPDLDRAAQLVARHEQPGTDQELQVLNDADGLSFFGLNSSGFLAYFGEEHTRMKVAYTLRRMRPEAQRYVRDMRLDAVVSSLVQAHVCTGALVPQA
jgi:hypothetical protein